jgi:dTDP-4-amino-4,6-dideoxygalactose transaminase
MEGGAIICHDDKTKQRIDYLKNFGFAGETRVMAPGINSKMNEMQAALGLLQLKHHDENIKKREQVAYKYKEALKEIEGINCLSENPDVTNFNHAYFPVFVDEKEFGKSRDELYFYLKEKGIYGRRYFYPLISQFPNYRGLESAKKENLPVAEQITRDVICLPIFPNLSLKTVEEITSYIKDFSK